MKLQTSFFCGTILQCLKALYRGKDKALIVLTVREMVKLFMIMFAVLVMSTATYLMARRQFLQARSSRRSRTISP